MEKEIKKGRKSKNAVSSSFRQDTLSCIQTALSSTEQETLSCHISPI